MPKSILLVDDDPAVLSVLARGLQGVDYDVTTCTNGESAMERLQYRTFDLLISDIRMPGLSGLTLTELARNQFPTLPILCLTAYPLPGQLKPNIPVLMKPLDLKTFRDQVARMLGSEGD